MRNKEGLTPKEHTFCEEYLRNGHNATKAYKVAWPGDSNECNSWRVIKRRAVIDYINKRIQEKQVTLDNLIEYGLTKLKQTMQQGTHAECTQAIKIAMEHKEELEKIRATIEKVDNRVKESEATPIVINIQSVEKPKDA